MIEETQELPDDLREPLHSLQADASYLIARVAADSSMAPLILQSLESRLSQVAEAAYRLNGRLLSSQSQVERMREALEKARAALHDAAYGGVTTTRLIMAEREARAAFTKEESNENPT